MLVRTGVPEHVTEYTRQQAGLYLVRGAAALRAGNADEAAACLQAALEHAQDPRERIRLQGFVPVLSELLPFGLERGIRVDDLCGLVKTLGLAPPDPAPARWPWAVRIHTLGRFEVTLNGQRLAHGRKVPQRTLALLAVLVALGGRSVPESRLSDILWPDLDGDAAHEAFGAALHRLRRLLGTGDAILQAGRALSLNPKRCFVDTWAFEAASADPARHRNAAALYRGPFLPDEDGAWALPLRSRLRQRFAQVVGALAASLRAAGDTEAAETLITESARTDPAVPGLSSGAARKAGTLRAGG